MIWTIAEYGLLSAVTVAVIVLCMWATREYSDEEIFELSKGDEAEETIYHSSYQGLSGNSKDRRKQRRAKWSARI